MNWHFKFGEKMIRPIYVFIYISGLEWMCK